MVVAGFDTKEERRLDEDGEGSFARNAARTCGATGVRAVHEPGSRADFLQGLQLLGARPEIRRLRNRRSTRLAVPVHVSCSRADWQDVFGEPECVEEVGLPSAQNSLYLWKHFCTDGPITCIGHLFVRWPGVRWVVVVRISLL